MRFTLRQLEYFIATAEAGSITLASDRIRVSQPSISTAISQLEIELGTQLFLRRHAQGLSLTPAGQKILVQAKAVIEQAQSLYTAASEAMDQVRGTLSLGCLLTFAPMLLPEVSHSFNAAYPGATVRPTVGDHSVLLTKLERAELDVALSYDLVIPDGFEFTPLAELPPYVQVAETDPLAERSAVTLAELAEREFILLDLPLSRDYFLGLFAAAGVTPNIVAQIQHQEVIRTMVGNRYGYTLANVRPKKRRRWTDGAWLRCVSPAIINPCASAFSGSVSRLPPDWCALSRSIAAISFPTAMYPAWKRPLSICAARKARLAFF